MAEKKVDTKKSSVKSQSNVSKIQVVGPKDSTNGAEILRFNREGNKKAIDITAGQYLKVGSGEDADITQEEAKRLLNYDRWDVKEVND